MKDLWEPIELTECELDSVAGGNPFSINVTAMRARVTASVAATLENNSANAQENTIDNSINVSGP